VALLAFGRERGWQHLRLLSSAGNAYNRDYHAETPEGHQRPMLNVFQRDGGGLIRLAVRRPPASVRP
jgi:predicted dithiol-disulfide oxidoreductase (DUF899 family)